MLSMLNEVSQNAIIHDSSKIVNQPLSGTAFFDFACDQMNTLFLFNVKGECKLPLKSDEVNFVPAICST